MMGKPNYENISLLHKRGKISVLVRRLGFFGRFSGLMFKSRDTENLLFDFGTDIKISIHSLFVFFPFLAVWLDSRNRVIELEIVKPFKLCIMPKRKFRKLVEIPLNRKNKEIMGFFVGRKDLNIKDGKYTYN